MRTLGQARHVISMRFGVVGVTMYRLPRLYGWRIEIDPTLGAAAGRARTRQIMLGEPGIDRWFPLSINASTPRSGAGRVRTALPKSRDRATDAF